MEAALLTARRGRSSIGPPGSPAKQTHMIGMVPQDQYDDCESALGRSDDERRRLMRLVRRKHSRQNREIVA